MSDFFSLYLQLAGPAIMLGLAVGGATAYLAGVRDYGRLGQAAGSGVLAVVILSFALAAFGVSAEYGYLTTIAAVVVGVAAGLALSRRAAA